MANKSVILSSSSFTGESFESIDVVLSDSDSWQFIDPSDSDDGNFSYADDDDDVTVSEENDDHVADVDDLMYGSPVSDISMKSLVDENALHCQKLENVYEINLNRQIIDVLKDDEITHQFQELENVYEITHNRNDLKDDEITHQFQEIDQSRLIINSGDEDDDDTHDDDDDELDDELVPKWLNNKFERQRMRKLGKRASSKMKKSKRIANQINRPGCVHGKHGLGLKHNLMW